MSSDIILYFIIYALLGWITEVVYCSIIDKKITNRGFLHGPFCPIYGFGALGIIYFLSVFSYNIFLLAILSILITSILEYITSYIMEKSFGISWWNYEDKKFNLHGRICLSNSIGFGILAVLLIYIIHPFIIDVTSNINESFKVFLATILMSIITIDLLVSVFETIHLLKIIREQKEKIAALILDARKEVKAKYDGKWSRYVLFHFTRHFPKLTSKRHKITFESIKEYFQNLTK